MFESVILLVSCNYIIYYCIICHSRSSTSEPDDIAGNRNHLSDKEYNYLVISHHKLQHLAFIIASKPSRLFSKLAANQPLNFGMYCLWTREKGRKKKTRKIDVCVTLCSIAVSWMHVWHDSMMVKIRRYAFYANNLRLQNEFDCIGSDAD